VEVSYGPKSASVLLNLPRRREFNDIQRALLALTS
jgi:hypothetical protein